MGVDLSAAIQFMAGHARTVDRHRLNLVLGQGNRDAALAAVDGYRNLDGGYGWGLEPDLRSVSSQPGGALHAFEVFADVGAPTPQAHQLCAWLQSASLADGGLPFALPISDPAACAPFWVSADPSASSLQITAIVCAAAARVAEFDPVVAQHPWFGAAVRFCLDAINNAEVRGALELAFALQFLDAIHRQYPEAESLTERLGARIPRNGVVHVEGGATGENMRPLDFSPFPGGPSRSLFDAAVMSAELSSLASRQQADGGWSVDFDSYSPAATLEWRGHATVKAIFVLKCNGVV
ncbi:hypothetical protein [Rhodococcus sp. ARC_M6]|uniref:hypothetical protein n=1 Tax=Rhodococcus sp. ARC_M6 TaxID=2928852 RepID=UPI001FB24937|nr:hypothetical protein [Rhodococcus sp. ARC_M6]MCJ0902884.1 hypothetical protein [Rhodococcus sp. ARC_M6]